MEKALANAAEALGKNLSSLLGKAAALPRVSSGSASMCRAVDGCFGSAGKLWADIKTFRNDRLPGVAIIRNFGTERPMSGAGIS